jgi:hypothetical protein
MPHACSCSVAGGPILIKPHISLINLQQSKELHEVVLITFCTNSYFKEYWTNNSALGNHISHADFCWVQWTFVVSTQVIKIPQLTVHKSL